MPRMASKLIGTELGEVRLFTHLDLEEFKLIGTCQVPGVKTPEGFAPIAAVIVWQGRVFLAPGEYEELAINEYHEVQHVFLADSAVTVK